MKKYRVEIQEVLSRIVTVEAESKDIAENLVLEQYNNQDIVLDESDFDGEVNINIIE